MDILTYFLACIIALSGILVGFFLALIAKEEVAAGKLYLHIMQKAILAAALAAVLWGLNAPAFAWLVSFLALAPFIIFKPNLYLAYFLFAIAFFASSSEGHVFFIVSCFAFMYGFPAGSLYAAEHHDKKRIIAALKALASVLHFPFVSMLLFLFLA